MTERPVGAGESGSVDSRPASEHQRGQRGDVGSQREAQELLHAISSVTLLDVRGQRHLGDKNFLLRGGRG